MASWGSSDRRVTSVTYFCFLPSPQLIKHFEIKPDPTMGELKSITRTVLVPDKPLSLHFVERQAWELNLLCMFCEHMNELMKMIWLSMRILFMILRILGVAGVRQKRHLWKFCYKNHSNLSKDKIDLCHAFLRRKSEIAKFKVLLDFISWFLQLGKVVGLWF